MWIVNIEVTEVNRGWLLINLLVYNEISNLGDNNTTAPSNSKLLAFFILSEPNYFVHLDIADPVVQGGKNLKI